MKRYIIFAVAVVVILSLTLCVFAQLATDQGTEGRAIGRGQGRVRGEGGARSGRGGGRRRGRGEAVPVPETGFVQLFDGKTLDGWEGTDRWKVEKGTIVAQTTAENPLRQNTFLIWRGGKPADFELKLEYRITGGNSGIQYRSAELENSDFAMRGYQADIDATLRYAGMIYEERGRGFLAPRSQVNYRGPSVSGTLASLGTSNELRETIKTDDWNEIHIIARGNTLIQIYNGRMMSMLIDDDTAGRAMEGLIGLQIHTGEPMKIEFRNIRLKQF
ncbi:MAG: 3-keto-disaccharide hydrolase [Planctomycetota bacterium]